MTTHRFLWLIAASCLFGAGCSMVDSGVRTLVSEPWAYCDFTDSQKAQSQHRRLAAEAWGACQATHPQARYSEDYRLGFQEGFVDFVDGGGTGEPPPLPPRRYWKSKYGNPAGQQAIQDWFQGFRTGAAIAAEQGYRRQAIIPSSECVCQARCEPPCPVDVPALPEAVQRPFATDGWEQILTPRPAPRGRSPDDPPSPSDRVPPPAPDRVWPPSASVHPTPSPIPYGTLSYGDLEWDRGAVPRQADQPVRLPRVVAPPDRLPPLDRS